MARPTGRKEATRLAMLERRAKAAELYRRGYPLSKIAKRLGVCKTTAHEDIKAVEKEWVESADHDYGVLVARREQELLLIYHEAYKGWIRSRKDGKPGDSAFLARMKDVVAELSKLLGTNAPTKIHQEGEAFLTTSQLMAEIDAAVEALKQQEGE